MYKESDKLILLIINDTGRGEVEMLIKKIIDYLFTHTLNRVSRRKVIFVPFHFCLLKVLTEFLIKY